MNRNDKILADILNECDQEGMIPYWKIVHILNAQENEGIEKAEKIVTYLDRQGIDLRDCDVEKIEQILNSQENVCPDCKGSGAIKQHQFPCDTCGGSGEILNAQENEDYQPNSGKPLDTIIDVLREPYDGHDFASLPLANAQENEQSMYPCGCSVDGKLECLRHALQLTDNQIAIRKIEELLEKGAVNSSETVNDLLDELNYRLNREGE